jgi:hypothetical protein
MMGTASKSCFIVARCGLVNLLEAERSGQPGKGVTSWNMPPKVTVVTAEVREACKEEHMEFSLR